MATLRVSSTRGPAPTRRPALVAQQRLANQSHWASLFALFATATVGLALVAFHILGR